MPNQFSVSDRQTIIDTCEQDQYFHQAVPLGPGVLAIYKRYEQHERTYHDLTAEHGWYVASYEAREDGDRVVFMPITEVPS